MKEDYMKRNLALLLILTLLLSVFSYAASETKSVGEHLKELGVIKGDAEGDLNENDNLTREEAITTVIRLMGKEKEALATKVEPSFTDVPKDSWAKPYIAYAEMKEWTNGIGEGKFGLGKNVTTKQYATYMLRVLGYGDTPYEQSMIQAAKLGLLDDVVATKGSAIITRADVFVIMNNTLNSKPKDKDEQLVYVLGLLKDKTETPKPEPKPQEPQNAAVKEVIADSLKQFKIVLTAPVESAGDEENYSLDGDGKAKVDNDSVFELSKDKKEIIVTMTKAAEQQEKVDLEIEDIFGKDVIIKDVQFLDRTIPEVVDIVVVGDKKIKVIFSEPMLVDGSAEKSMLNKDNYEVFDKDDDSLYIEKITAANKQGTAAIVQLYSELDNDVTVSVENIDDYAGFGVIAKKVQASYNKDKTAPKLLGYKASSLRKVTLVFDEDIALAKDKSAFYHTNTSNKAESVEASGKDLIITFAKGDEMPAGTTYIYIKDEAIEDLWGNLLDGRQKYEITVTTDKTAPQVEGKVKVKSQRKLEIKFDEAIEKNSDFDITLLKNGDIVKNDYTESINKNILSLTFEKDLYGKYKLIVEGLEDEMSNEIDKIALSFEADDATAPVAADFKATAYKIGENNQLLIVQFGDKMKESDILSLDNYELDHKFLSDLEDVTVKAIDDNEAVKITIPEDQFDFTNDNLSNDNKLLTIGKMSDAAGNKMNDFSVKVHVKNGDKTGIKIEEVRLVTNKKIEFEIADKLSDVTVKQFVIFHDGDKLKLASHAVDDMKNGNTVVSFKLADSVGTNPEDENLKYVVRDKADLESDDLTPSKNRYGQILMGEQGDIEDKCAPEVDKVVLVDDETIYVYFTEDLDSGYISSKGKNGFSVSEGEVDSATLHSSKNNVIVIEGEDFTKYSNINYEDSNIYDLAGNEMESFRYKERLKTAD